MPCFSIAYHLKLFAELIAKILKLLLGMRDFVLGLLEDARAAIADSLEGGWLFSSLSKNCVWSLSKPPSFRIKLPLL
jgi:hypothetical protein